MEGALEQAQRANGVTCIGARMESWTREAVRGKLAKEQANRIERMLMAEQQGKRSN